MSTNGSTLPTAHIPAERVTAPRNPVLPLRSAGPVPEPQNVADSNPLLLALNGLLRESWVDLALEARLDQAVARILALPGLTAGLRGAVYLIDAHGNLQLTASHCFPENASPHRDEAGIAERLGINVGASGKIGILPAGEVLYAGAPILDGPDLLGVFVAVSPHGRPLESGSLRLIAETLAALIAHTRTETENRRLLEENRRLNRRLISVLEDEARRLARELHDEIGQSLTAIKADAALILNRCGTTASSVCRSAQAISETADHLYDVTHAMIRQLRPGALDDLGLTAALRSCVHAWHERRPGTACTFDVEGEIDALGEDINITIYRITQEALNNVIRHAAATRVDISLRYVPTSGGTKELCLEIRDDGRGVDLESLHAKQRYGLVGIRERVEDRGGRLLLVSRPGAGFSLKAYLPAPEAV